jgi:hypothetical protein
MKSAEEWAREIGRPASCIAKCNRGCDDFCRDPAALARAIQSDARESALREAAAMVSHWGEEQLSEQILSLIPKGP